MTTICKPVTDVAVGDVLSIGRVRDVEPRTDLGVFRLTTEHGVFDVSPFESVEVLSDD